MLEVYVVDGLISLVELKQNFHTGTKLSTMYLNLRVQPDGAKCIRTLLANAL
jgi:hypothetical protein